MASGGGRGGLQVIAKRPTIDWQDLAATSHYRTAVAVQQALQEGNVDEARFGIQELVDALARAEKRALRSQLIRLMAHIIKWQTQPERRSRSWRTTIRSARREIGEIQEDTPSLTRDVIEAMWESCFEAAKEEAEAEMNQDSSATSLTWEQVFEQEYDLGQSAPGGRARPPKKRP
jgi:hypothetical protein